MEVARPEGGPLLLLDDLGYRLGRGERVGVVGRNGAGKTSFLRALVGEAPLTGGERRVGETVTFGYYDQRGLNAPPGGVPPPGQGGSGGGGGGSGQGRGLRRACAGHCGKT